MNTSATTTSAPSTSSRTAGQKTTGSKPSPNSAIRITLQPSPSPNNSGGARPPGAPSLVDPEILTLRAQIDDLETKLALHRRREQLDREYARALSADESRAALATIVQHCCTAFAIGAETFWHGTKTEQASLARHAARALAREQFPLWSNSALARAFRVDHACILNSLRFVPNRSSIDPAFAAHITKLRSQLSSRSRGNETHA